MKLWRGQPDHDYWRLLLNPRDRAFMSFGLGVVAFGMAIFQYLSPGAACRDGGRLLCTLVHALAAGSGASVELAEVVLWALFGLSLTIAGGLQWRRR
jgi:hypothetical protein